MIQLLRTCNEGSVAKPFNLVSVLTKIAHKSNQDEAWDVVCRCNDPHVLTGHLETFLNSGYHLIQVAACKSWKNRFHVLFVTTIGAELYTVRGKYSDFENNSLHVYFYSILIID